MKTEGIKKPTVHLNGTSRRYLLETHQRAFGALGEALEAIKAAAPNGRDFYPQGERAIVDAIEQHRDRLLRIQTVMNEVATLLEHIADGADQ